jgi:hypothetical protein
MAWTSPRTWIPGEFVTASMLNTHLRDNLLFLFGGSKLASYTATKADVNNTVTETDVCHFTVPGGAWSDGDVVKCEIACLAKNNKGTTGLVTFKVNVGAGAQVQLRQGAGASGTVSNFNNDATEYRVIFRFFCRRVGSDVWIADRDYDFITDTVGNVHAINNPFLRDMAICGVSTPTNFTGDNVITLKITLDAANSTYYVKPQAAQVLHFKN